MDAIREVKEEPCLEETLNEGYQLPHMDFQDKFNCAVGYKDTNLSNAYQLASEIDIKEEPCYFGAPLNEMKIELEQPHVTQLNLQHEANFEMGCSNDNLMLNGYKVATRTEVKEEHLWDGRTSEDVKTWTILSLDSDPLSQNGIKAAASCISGIQDYLKAEPIRLPADAPCSDGYEISGYSNNAQSLQMKEVSVEYERQEADDAFFHDVSSSQMSVEQSNAVTQNNAKPFKCLVCGKNFRYSYYLKRHMLVHSGEKPYECDICEKKFAQRAQLKTHRFVHSDTKPHQCDFCEMSFTQLGNLKKHISTHLGLKPYKCDVCEKGFIAQSILSRHMLTHSAVKPFKCDICQKRFTDSSVLTRHKLIHSIVHKCDVCQKTFSRRSALKKHKYTFSHT